LKGLFVSWKMKAPFREVDFPKIFLSLTLSLFAAAFVPVVGAVFLFFLPLVVFYHAARSNAAKTFLALATSFLCLLLAAYMLQRPVPVISMVSLSLTGLMLLTLKAGNAPIEKTILLPTIFLVSAAAIFFSYGAWLHSMAPWDFVKNYIAAAIQENINMYQRLPLRAGDIRPVVDNEKRIIEGLTRIFPALVAVSSAFIVWANVLWGKNLLAKQGVAWPGLESLCRWTAPDGLVWIFIASGALLFARRLALNLTGLNVFLMVTFVYFLQGLAILSYVFQIKGVPRFFRFFFYFFIAVQQWLMIPLSLLGLFDTWFNFRKYFRANHPAD